MNVQGEMAYFSCRERSALGLSLVVDGEFQPIPVLKVVDLLARAYPEKQAYNKWLHEVKAESVGGTVNFDIVCNDLALNQLDKIADGLAPLVVTGVEAYLKDLAEHPQPPSEQ
jgi:hypothetical protein